MLEVSACARRKRKRTDVSRDRPYIAFVPPTQQPVGRALGVRAVGTRVARRSDRRQRGFERRPPPILNVSRRAGGTMSDQVEARNGFAAHRNQGRRWSSLRSA